MSGEEVLIPLAMFTGGFATLFGIFYLRNRENMALIERGFNPREGTRRFLSRSFWPLRYGLMFAGIGLGLFIAFLVDVNIHHQMITEGGYTHREDYPQIYFSLIALFGGLGLMLSYRVERKEIMQSGEKEEVQPTQSRPYDQVIS